MDKKLMLIELRNRLFESAKTLDRWEPVSIEKMLEDYLGDLDWEWNEDKSEVTVYLRPVPKMVEINFVIVDKEY